MIICGVDPGINGGVVALDKKGKYLSALAGIPTIYHLLDFLALYFPSYEKNDLLFYVEKAQSMPKQGVSSTFTYGKGYGEILGALSALRYSYVLVPPRVWTKAMFKDIPEDLVGKKRAAYAAAQLLPSSIDLKKSKRCKKDHEGLVDAYLIAEYGRRILIN